MKITEIEVFHVDAGWRPWTFVKIITDESLVGWSECSDSHGSPLGIEAVIKQFRELILGKDPRDINRILWILHSRTRQSPGSIIQKAISGIENALWDIKAKALNVPVFDLWGGKLREKIPLYWSHCGTSRVRAYEIIKKPRIASISDLEEFGLEFKSSGFKALKTNIAIFDSNPHIYMPGFYKSEGGPSLDINNKLLDDIYLWIATLRDSVGSNIEIALDLNFNFKTDGFIKVARRLKGLNIAWLEIDTYDFEALKHIKESIDIPITSCENLYGAKQYKPFIINHCMDYVSIDVIWNGFSESKKISDLAEIHEINISPHNFNGYLSTFISMNLCAVIPNLKLGEIDVDDVPWREELFTNIPLIEDGSCIIKDNIGWGCDINEKILNKYRWAK